MASVHYLLNRLLCAKKCAAASPTTFDRLQSGVAVISDEVLYKMLRHAEDQSAILPLKRGQRSKRHKMQVNLENITNCVIISWRMFFSSTGKC